MKNLREVSFIQLTTTLRHQAENVGATGLVAPTFYLQEYMPQG